MSSAVMPPASRDMRRLRLPPEWFAVPSLALLVLIQVHVANAAAPAAAPTSDDFEILQYRTRIEPDLSKKSVAGTTTIRFRPTRAATAEIAFPLNALQVDAVRLNGAATPFSIRNGDAPRSLMVPLTGKTTGAQELAVDYHAAPAQGMKFGANYVYTAFSTCHWMLCREESGGKAAFRLELIVPSGYQVVAGGVARSREALPGGRTLHVWEEERPYSPYLFGFAAGEMTEATLPSGGTSLRVLGVGQSAGELTRKFQDTTRMLAFFEAKAGGPLPHKTYTQVLVPGSEAQEAGTFSIIGRDQLDPILADPQEDWVIAHELAHQWWGNLITCRDWSHFWLNEGLTVFMTAAYKEQRWGPAAYTREIALAERRRQTAIDANFDVPLAYAGAYPSLSVKRAVTYSKGFLFIDLLRKRLGEEKFWRGIKAYTQTHLGRTVDSHDFQRALEAAGGESLAALFGEWVYPL